MDAEQTLEALLEVIDTKSNAEELVAATEALLEAYLELKADTEARQAKLDQAVESAIDKLNVRIKQIKNGIDGKNYVLTAKDKKDIAKSINVPIVEKTVETIIKEQPIVTEITKEVALADTPEQIADKLNTLEDAIDAKVIKGLDKVVKRYAVNGGGSMGLSVGHWPLHEAFTMDGVATSVSLTQGGVGAAGTACIVRYQGQTLDLTSQYSVNGNKITLVGFTPEADTIISVTYWP
jgi:hypothetical protein